jgi:hypothetical protein
MVSPKKIETRLIDERFSLWYKKTIMLKRKFFLYGTLKIVVLYR